MFDQADSVTLAMALLAGFLGSGHCLAMCGGIACLPGTAGDKKPLRLVVFNLGRLASYALLGGLAAVFGAGLLGLTTGQVAPTLLRVGAAAMVMLIALHLLWPARVRVPGQVLGARFWRLLAPLAKPLAAQRTVPALFALGALWGWLPCGLVYAMLGAAAISGTAANGAAIMVAFGLGTLPAMLVTGLSGLALMQRLRNGRYRSWAGVLLLIAAVWMAWMPVVHWIDGGAADHSHHQMATR